MHGKNSSSIFNLKFNNSKLKKDMERQHNQAPDEAMLTLWTDGELNGDELARVELWAQDHPELLVERDAVRAMQSSIQANMPASVEPPYADFFNLRILRAIENEKAESGVRVRSTEPYAGVACTYGCSICETCHLHARWGCQGQYI